MIGSVPRSLPSVSKDLNCFLISFLFSYTLNTVFHESNVGMRALRIRPVICMSQNCNYSQSFGLAIRLVRLGLRKNIYQKNYTIVIRLKNVSIPPSPPISYSIVLGMICCGRDSIRVRDPWLRVRLISYLVHLLNLTTLGIYRDMNTLHSPMHHYCNTIPMQTGPLIFNLNHSRALTVRRRCLAQVNFHPKVPYHNTENPSSMGNSISRGINILFVPRALILPDKFTLVSSHYSNP